MFRLLLSLSVRLCLGIIVVLNGPGNALAFGLAGTHSCCAHAAHEAEIPQGKKQGPKKCCGHCPKNEQSTSEGQNSTPKQKPSKIRPTCPVCPLCPNSPSGCCLCCPCKAPCSPPVVFVMPESPEIVWRFADEAISYFDSHSDEPTLPPRSSQSVAFAIS